MQDNNLWCSYNHYIKRKFDKWSMYNLRKEIIYENTLLDSYVPPQNGWIKIKEKIEIKIVEPKVDPKICIIIYTYNRPYSLQRLLNNIQIANIKLDVYIYDDCSIYDQIYNDKDYKFTINYYKFKKHNGLLKQTTIYNYILKDFRNKNYEYYYIMNDNIILLDNFFSKSIEYYNEINDVNKIVLNLCNKGLKKVWCKFNPIKYNKNMWLNNWIEMGCFMFQKQFFIELRYELADSYDINRYLTQVFNKFNKHMYIVDKTLVIEENNRIA